MVEGYKNFWLNGKLNKTKVCLIIELSVKNSVEWILRHTPKASYRLRNKVKFAISKIKIFSHQFGSSSGFYRNDSAELRWCSIHIEKEKKREILPSFRYPAGLRIYGLFGLATCNASVLVRKIISSFRLFSWCFIYSFPTRCYWKYSYLQMQSIKDQRVVTKI